MFKLGSFEDDLFQGMEKQLLANHIENEYSFNKLAKAADLLNAAASIFDQAEMHEEANDITQILQELSSQLQETK